MKHTWILMVSLLAGTSLYAAAPAAAPAQKENLMPNGNFENAENPFKYWTVEYPNNQNYNTNLKYCKLLPEYGGKKNVLMLLTNKDPSYGGFERWMTGAQAESPMVPFEQGCRYRMSFSIMANTAYHIYLIGYSFKPGLKPYEHPVLDDLRMRAKGGIMEQTAKKDKWTTVTCDWPEKVVSENSLKSYKYVQFISMHFINITGIGEVYIKDLTCEKLPDGYTGGKITADDKEKPGAAQPGKTSTLPAKTSKTGKSSK